jgi:hypothetical protein
VRLAAVATLKKQFTTTVAIVVAPHWSVVTVFSDQPGT